MVIKELGNTIRQRRKVLNITQQHLADLSDINVNTVARMEKGTVNPTLEVINAIADVLGMELTLSIKKIS